MSYEKNIFGLKKILLSFFIILFSFSLVSAENVEDTSIIDELNKNEIKSLDFDFKLKSFESCDWLEKVMWDYIKKYWENNKEKWSYPIYYRWGWMMFETSVMEDSVVQEATTSNIEKSAWIWSDDYSETNVQVKWIDESDIAKTDWKYIYYYNETDKYVYIVDALNLQILKKIKLPNSFYNPVLYIWNNRLTIISSWYSEINYEKFGYYINRNSKTYTIVFDTTDIKKPVLSKLYVADWDLTKSRKIGDYVYVISNNSFSIPYYTFKWVDDIEIDYQKLLPKKIDISKTSDKSKQNLELKWIDLPYNIKSWNIAKCSDIEYVLPDEETIKEYDFSPSYNIISIIDTKNTSNEVKTKVIAGSNSEIYMSLDNLYLTSNIYQSNNFSCPANARCFAPWFSRGTNTLVHKVNVKWSDLKYQDSTIIPWNPLTQYSMDEYKWDFRILTQTNNWNSTWNESYTDLYILDKDLALKWSLKNLWWGEQFKSSRYIGDKLFLVTFKQVDPLYVIDVSDSTNPKILWELKIPWYSTYLHPYDENHLIWLWYNTTENQWGWTINNGLKVDLYEINYDKKCWDSNLNIDEQKKCDSWDYKWILVKQKFTKVLWQNWSYSEALDNPRMFMWKSNDNKLFLPVTLYSNSKDDLYRYTDFFQWLVTLTIDNINGIKEDFKLTHLDTSKAESERNEECSKYSKKTTEKKCVQLIWWWEYCENAQYRYVPKYCYEDSSVWEYVASKNWEYRNSFIKRVLWIDNSIYSISDDKISSTDINSGLKTSSIELIK